MPRPKTKLNLEGGGGDKHLYVLNETDVFCWHHDDIQTTNWPETKLRSAIQGTSTSAQSGQVLAHKIDSLIKVLAHKINSLIKVLTHKIDSLIKVLAHKNDSLINGYNCYLPTM